MRQGVGRFLFGFTPVIFALGIISFLVAVPSVQALTIDEFNANSNQSVEVSGASGSGSAGFSASEVVGGRRVLNATSTSGFVSARILQSEGLLRYSQEVLSQGGMQVIWDGGLDGSVNPAGLGSIDLGEDGGTALKLLVVRSDLNGAPLTGRFTVYDASGVGVSFAEFVLNSDVLPPIPPQEVSVPFASFQAGAGGVPANFSTIGAITLSFTGAAEAVDLAIDLIGTDGNCPRIPVAPGGVLDECGVCGGDSSSCVDCLGVPNGPALPGVSCPTGIPGQCGPGSYNQQCQCVPNDPPESEVCDSIDNDCDGLVDEDAGICADCAGQLGGSAILDRCGVCEGDGKSCLGCSEKDLDSILRAMDGGAKRQEAYIKKILRGVDRLVDTKTRKELTKFRAEVHRLQIENWTLSWTVPVISKVCENTQFCVSVSNQWIIDKYRVNSETLRKMGHKAITLSRKYLSPSSRTINGWKLDINELHAQNMALASTVPVLQFSCAE